METGANKPFELNEPESVWYVTEGRVDIFFVPSSEGSLKSSRQFLYTAQRGDLIFGIGSPVGKDPDLIFLGVGSLGTVVAKQNIKSLFDHVLNNGIGNVVAGALGMDCSVSRLCNSIEKWIMELTQGICLDTPPNHYIPARPSATSIVPADYALRPVKSVLWMRCRENFTLNSTVKIENKSDEKDTCPLFPLSKFSWTTFDKEVSVDCFKTKDMLYRKSLLKGIMDFKDKARQICVYNFAVALSSEVERLDRKEFLDDAKITGSLIELANMVKPNALGEHSAFVDDISDPLMAVCTKVGKFIGVEIKRLNKSKSVNSRLDPITRICLASKVRSRDVLLKGIWWKKDVGALVGFLDPEHNEDITELQPVAIIPDGGNYNFYDPRDKSLTPINKKSSEKLHPVAYTFYSHLPHRPITIMDLFKYGTRGKFKDAMVVVSLALFGGVFGMIMPIVTGQFFSTIIPSADKNQLLQYCLGLFAVGIGTGAFELTRSYALLRIGAKTEHNLQAAIWDRLLNLPMSFFNQYNVGDLATRAGGISSIYKMISGTVANSLLSGIFSVFNLVLLFYYNFKLAILAIVFVLITLIISTIQSYMSLRIQRKSLDIGGKTTSLVLQLIFGIPKLRVAGAEKRAFKVWTEKYIEGRSLGIKADKIGNAFSVVNSIMGILPTLCIYYFVANYLKADPNFNLGKFMAFNAAFGQFMASTLSVSGIFLSIMGIFPTYERAKPILDAQPEVDDDKADPGELSGEIEISHLHFKYDADGPLILDNVDLTAHAGEFIAVVGPSGSGKSTLLKLLLGFEKPENGVIYYDGKNAGDLDPHALRQQLGVVLQNGKVIAGDIFSNIVGANRLSIEKAWEAAKMAGLDKDIQAMPMGMHTVISEGGGTFSGGQRQRLLISRAMVTKPRIIFFDEATSALDNATQAIVTESLDKIAATRIVIAHRLSTIINADRIYVMDKGRVVQNGTFDELMRQSGPFADLARRQML